MSSDFWTGVVNLTNVVGILILSGLSTASSAGAGWSSLESMSSN